MELRELVQTDLPETASLPLPGPGDKWKRPLSMGIIKSGVSREANHNKRSPNP